VRARHDYGALAGARDQVPILIPSLENPFPAKQSQHVLHRNR